MVQAEQEQYYGGGGSGVVDHLACRLVKNPNNAIRRPMMMPWGVGLAPANTGVMADATPPMMPSVVVILSLFSFICLLVCCFWFGE